MTRYRMFAAVWPPPTVIEQLGALERPEVDGLRWTSADQWHVTLRFFGSVDEEDRAALGAVWQGLDLAALGPVEAKLGPATARFGDRVLHIPVAGLERLAAVVQAATADIGERPDPRPFSGHVTLARSQRRAPNLRALAGTPIDACWTVDEVTLVVSRTGPDRAQYEVVERRGLG